MFRAAPWCVLLWLVVSGGPRAHAHPHPEGQPGAEASTEERRELAKRTFYAAEQAYKLGQYAVAIQAYEQAYAYYPTPALLFNKAQAHRKLYDLKNDLAEIKLARDLYERFLREDPTSARTSLARELISEIDAKIAAHVERPRAEAAPEAPPETQAIVTSTPAGAEVVIDDTDFAQGGKTPYIRKVEPGRHVAHFRARGYEPAKVAFEAQPGKIAAAQVVLREIPGRLAVAGLPGATVTVDGIAVGITPLGGVEVPAGRRRVRVARAGRVPFSAELDVPRAEQVRIEARLPMSPRRKAALATLGVAAASGLAGGVFGLAALSADGDVERDSRRPLQPAELGAYADRVDQARGRALAADVLLGVAATAAVVGVVLYFWEREAPEDARLRAGAGGLGGSF